MVLHIPVGQEPGASLLGAGWGDGGQGSVRPAVCVEVRGRQADSFQHVLLLGHSHPPTPTFTVTCGIRVIQGCLVPGFGEGNPERRGQGLTSGDNSIRVPRPASPSVLHSRCPRIQPLSAPWSSANLDFWDWLSLPCLARPRLARGIRRVQEGANSNRSSNF